MNTCTFSLFPFYSITLRIRLDFVHWMRGKGYIHTVSRISLTDNGSEIWMWSSTASLSGWHKIVFCTWYLLSSKTYGIFKTPSTNICLIFDKSWRLNLFCPVTYLYCLQQSSNSSTHPHFNRRLLTYPPMLFFHSDYVTVQQINIMIAQNTNTSNIYDI